MIPAGLDGVRHPFIRRKPPGPAVGRMEARPLMIKPDRRLGGSPLPRRNESNCVGSCANSALPGVPLNRRRPLTAAR